MSKRQQYNHVRVTLTPTPPPPKTSTTASYQLELYTIRRNVKTVSIELHGLRDHEKRTESISFPLLPNITDAELVRAAVWFSPNKWTVSFGMNFKQFSGSFASSLNQNLLAALMGSPEATSTAVAHQTPLSQHDAPTVANAFGSSPQFQPPIPQLGEFQQPFSSNTQSPNSIGYGITQWYKGKTRKTKISLWSVGIIVLIAMIFGVSGALESNALNATPTPTPTQANQAAQVVVTPTPQPTNSTTPTPTPTPTHIIGNSPTPTVLPSSGGLLPGEQLWKNGVSSLIFGVGDTGEWGMPNLEFTDSQTAPGTPNTAVQNLVKQAGFTLLRKFVDHHDFATNKEMTGAELQAISNTFVNTNTQCMMVLSADNINASSKRAGDVYTDLQFAQHVVTLFDGNHPGYTKCSMFEIGNEPDINGVDVNQYLTIWNTFVPALKQLRPDAKFLGPVVAGYNPDYIIGFLSGVVQKHYQIPDAISWHYYPCGWGSEAKWGTCLADMAGSTQNAYFNNIVHEAADIRAKIQNVLGHQLPIGISEWSVDPNGSMQDTEPQYSQFVTQALNDMITAKLDFAAIFDLQSQACYDGCDIIDLSGKPKPSFNAFMNIIGQYK